MGPFIWQMASESVYIGETIVLTTHASIPIEIPVTQSERHLSNKVVKFKNVRWKRQFLQIIEWFCDY